MQNYFFETVDSLIPALEGQEVLLANFHGEQSDFIRFNNSSVRQPGSVAQSYLSLELTLGNRHAKATAAISGNRQIDGPVCRELLSSLRATMRELPEDPHFLYATEVHNTEQIASNRLPGPEVPLEAVLKAGAGKDLVGIYAQGGIFSGFANSLGQRNWLATYSFQLDWSYYLQKDKAVKTTFAGYQWDPAELDRKAAGAAEQLAILALPAKTIEPGKYRVYLAPAALEEILGMTSMGGFSLKAHRTKTTPLLKMLEAGAMLAPAVTLTENIQEGIAPNFQSSGFVKPPRLTLIDRGRLAQPLISPRSAREYSLATNGAGAEEMPESMDLSAGNLPADQVLAQLDTGVYVNRLWYLNFSDRPACRITGMTRFATFWVEHGRIAAPLNVMRFDDTAYHILGENLLALTADRDFLVSTSTYGGRSTTSTRLPGALVKDFAFTL